MTDPERQHMITIIHEAVIHAAMSLLPPTMDTPPARAILLAIGLQESKFEHRKQVGGPARGFWQFEYGGVLGVAGHRATDDLFSKVCARLRYDDSAETVYRAIEHNDVLACVMARLLLWTLPCALPDRFEPMRGWDQYLDAWRPGKPHVGTWRGHWKTAWNLVEPLT